MKPDPRTFRVLAARHYVEPSRAVFVDDTPGCVAAAREVEFYAVVFCGAEALRAELMRLGVVDSESGARAT